MPKIGQKIRKFQTSVYKQKLILFWRYLRQYKLS